ncbi:MAG: hypothetical protein ACRDID_01235 [Ktedonobacterales bacterium]
MTDQHLTQMRLDDAPVAPEEPIEPAQPDLLTPDPLIVRLNKVFSWQQSASRWPYYLSRAEPGRVYTKPEIIAEIFSGDDGRRKRPERGWLQGLYGVYVDRERAEVTLDGVGLFESVDGAREHFRISDDGLALAHAYSADRDSQKWKRVFAGILARNDVRVRAVLLHLARWGAHLTFTLPSAQSFFAPKSGGALRLPDGAEQPLFDYIKGGEPAYSFTPVLQRDPYATLGPFLRARIERAGVRIPERVELQGGREPRGRTGNGANLEPSSNDLRLHMKQALALFRDIGALVYVEHRQGWTLDPERCAALFAPELVADLFDERAQDRFLEALRAAYAKLSDGEGYVRVADIRDYVADELDIPPGERVGRFNALVAYELRPEVGKLRLGRVFHAQATPDECLFGNLDMEYVEFIFP